MSEDRVETTHVYDQYGIESEEYFKLLKEAMSCIQSIPALARRLADKKAKLKEGYADILRRRSKCK